jgi:hypothetical protein
MSGEHLDAELKIMRSEQVDDEYKRAVLLNALDRTVQQHGDALRQSVTRLHRLAEAWVSQLYAEARR